MPRYCRFTVYAYFILLRYLTASFGSFAFLYVIEVMRIFSWRAGVPSHPRNHLKQHGHTLTKIGGLNNWWSSLYRPAVSCTVTCFILGIPSSAEETILVVLHTIHYLWQSGLAFWLLQASCVVVLASTLDRVRGLPRGSCDPQHRYRFIVLSSCY